MVQCPKCSTTIDAEFGMVTCPNCQSVVFIEFDGTAKIADDEQIDRSQKAEQMNLQDGEANELPHPDLSAFDEALSESMFTLDPAIVASENPLSQLSQPESEGSPQTRPTMVSSEVLSPNDPLGVTDYANSEFSQGKDGPLLFNLFIEGLDSKEIRDSLREAMNDSRFSWDSAQLLGQIRNGQLLITNVSPVQASILVNRLKRLPLSISWEQHAITTIEKF